MKTQSLAFFFGVLLLQFFTSLPNLYWVNILFVISIVLITFYYFYPIKKYFFKNILILFIFFNLGYSWNLWFAHHQLDWSLSKNLEEKPSLLSGYIATLPVCNNHYCSFLFSSEHHLIKLSTQCQEVLKIGDEWQFMTILKRIHGTINPGEFDYEGWAYQQNIRAEGYVMISSNNKKLASHWYHYPWGRFRQFLQNKIETNLPKTNTSPWIEALILGERHNIAPDQWSILRNTGTNHLMAIAGLHIGFVALFSHKLVCAIWRRRIFLTLWMPAQEAGAIAALCMALLYSALSGFSIPTERACIMLSAFLVTLLLRRKIKTGQTWCIALLGILLLNPASILTESFWLSLGSIVLIIYGMSGRFDVSVPQYIKKIRNWGKIQYVIAIGLIPFSIWLFQQVSLIGFIANSIAIPWVGLLVLPFCIISVFFLLFSNYLGSLTLIVADKSLSVLWIILSYLSHLSFSSLHLVMPNYSILWAACIGVCILLLPAGLPGRYLGFIWILPLILFKPEKPNIGEAWFTLLDVGQGLSTVIQTKNHVLVFDAGSALSKKNDQGENVVTPFLYTLDVHQVDRLIISHGDNDHIGGAFSILKNFNVLKIESSVPNRLAPYAAQYCLQGESWRWDGVKFEFLYPTINTLNLNNDSSCVLRISTGDTHILLTGDIEKSAERTMAQTIYHQLKAQVLIAPHHGSKTSAEDIFLEAVQPQIVLYPVGYLNRYHFPNKTVVQKYQMMGIQQFDTANSGTIQLKIANHYIGRIASYRLLHSHYWSDATT